MTTATNLGWTMPQTTVLLNGDNRIPGLGGRTTGDFWQTANGGWRMPVAKSRSCSQCTDGGEGSLQESSPRAVASSSPASQLPGQGHRRPQRCLWGVICVSRRRSPPRRALASRLCRLRLRSRQGFRPHAKALRQAETVDVIFLHHEPAFGPHSSACLIINDQA